MLQNQRDKFEIAEGVTYLNCAYMSPSLNSVVKAGESAVRLKQAPWNISPKDFFEPSERVRTQFAKLAGVDSEGVFLANSASFGLCTAASILPLKTGGTIVLLKDQFPSNVYPWTRAARQANGRVTFANKRSNQTWTDAVLAQLEEPSVEIAAIPHCHWTDGSRLDLVTIADACRARQIRLVLDLSQSLGAMPLDLDTVNPDFMVSVGYKWLFGPVGLAYGYVAPQWRSADPLDLNWINREGAEDFSKLVEYRDSYQDGARRFDIGGKCAIHLAMANAALEQLQQWSVPAIAAQLSHLTDYLCNRAKDAGLIVEPTESRSPHMTGVRLHDASQARTLMSRLADRRIMVSLRGDSVRVAPHLYNSQEDIDALIEAIVH